MDHKNSIHVKTDLTMTILIATLSPQANITSRPSNQSWNYIKGITSTLTPLFSSKHRVKNVDFKCKSIILFRYVWRHTLYIAFLQLNFSINVLRKYGRKTHAWIVFCLHHNKQIHGKQRQVLRCFCWKDTGCIHNLAWMPNSSHWLQG